MKTGDIPEDSQPPTGFIFFIGPAEDDQPTDASRELVAVAKVAARELAFECWYNLSGTGPFREDLFERLDRAAVVIADVSGRHPSVLYEIGVAHAFRTPVILLAPDDERQPFNLISDHVIKVSYVQTGKLENEERVEGEIKKSLDAVKGGPPEADVTNYLNERERRQRQAVARPSAGPGDGWMIFAEGGHLVPLVLSHLEELRRWVVHPEHGVGEIVGYEVSSGGRTTVSVRFTDVLVTHSLEGARLFLPEAAP